MKKNILIALAAILLLASCQGDDVFSTSEESIASSSSEEREVSLLEAIENTRDEYELSVVSDSGYATTFSILANDFYYYAPNGIGYCVLDDDRGYFHGFDLSVPDDSIASDDYIMTMYGRYAVSTNRDIFAYDFMDILMSYMDDFTKVSANVYACTVTELGTKLRDFFQNRSYSYTNYYELTIKNGKIDTLVPYEKSLEESYAYTTLKFSSFDKEEYAPYVNWKESGASINLRIFDLKQGYNRSASSWQLLYEGEEVEIDGHVAAFDYDGAFYVTCQDSSTGNVGIRVRPKDGEALPELGDTLSLRGTIVKDGYVAYLNEATYEVTGHQDYFPYFDEEAIANSYGGGYYAAYIFSQTPVYGDSVYSTYAYVESLPDSVSETDEDAIGLICPTQTEDSETFRMELVLPSGMLQSEKEEALESLKTFGIYGETGVKEVYLEKFILRFDAEYEYRVKLEYALGSSLSASLTAAEKIEKTFGVSVPLIESDEYVCFKFGASTGYLLEPYYGFDSSSTTGIYYYDDSVTASEWTAEISALEEAGFSILDEVKDIYDSKHILFSNGEIVIDTLTYDNASYGDEDEYALYLWIYEGEALRMASIKETLEANIPYFESDDFIVDDVYDYYFTYYQLHNYAGNVYSEGSYLNCVTMDTDKGDSYLLELAKKYIAESGYSLCRNEDNSMYRYTTRGSQHYVLYKTIDGSSEKVYVDLALYSTDDYTYVGHDEFTNRIEVLIYKGSEPLAPNYDTNLDYLCEFEKENYGIDLSFDISSAIKVENYYEVDGGSAFIDYGYYFQYQLFVYTSSVSTTLGEIQEGLTESGYELSYTSSKGNYCYKNDDSYVFVMPRTSSGYIRIIDSVGGSNF